VDSTLDGSDIGLMATTIWGEARGEPLIGKVAVAYVILTRAKRGGWYGNTIKEVIMKPYQFSAWNRNDPNFAKMSMTTMADNAYRDCMYATLGAVQKHLPNLAEGATHYHTLRMRPYWIKDMRNIATIGNHIFYEEG
tara:strand:- start:1240 stop:1650 length:411 start_codon:yes stop_codon:yes gene_type:complete